MTTPDRPEFVSLHKTTMPPMVRAVQLTDDADWGAIAAWCEGDVISLGIKPGGEHIRGLVIPPIGDEDATHPAQMGDWVVEGITGHFFWVTPDRFARAYRPAGPTTAPNLVGLLRERVEMAAMVTDTVTADTDDTIIALFEAVCALRRATTSPADPMVQAVARALLAPEGQTTTEWCAVKDGEPNDDNARRITFDPAIEAENEQAGGFTMTQWAKNHAVPIARRTVTRGPWQVVTTEDGQS